MSLQLSPHQDKTAHPASRVSFRAIRIVFLLFVLIVIGLGQWMVKQRIMDWNRSLWVVLYPINGDGSPQSTAYIQSLNEDIFNPVESFMETEGLRYRLGLQDPIRIELAPQVNTLPPTLHQNASLLKIVWWSLKMRFWAQRSDTYQGPTPDIRIFAIFFDPLTHKSLNHSFGLEKGRLAIANVYATPLQAEQNNFVIAHELLHTIGASDKYHLETTQPRHPDGYAEPDKAPLYPQNRAEIMGGRIPHSPFESELPNDLSDARIGEQTAKEIRWRE